MNDRLIKNWNNRVKDTDTIFILGDFDWKNNNAIKHKLKGNKIFIKGNHDKNEMITDAFVNILKKQWLMTHNPNERYPRILHGHVHTLWKYKVDKTGIKINVGVDVWDYKPINLQTIINLINNPGEKQ
jgi:calcineurin-like phosphoesterase family protein